MKTEIHSWGEISGHIHGYIHTQITLRVMSEDPGSGEWGHRGSRLY